MRELHIALKEWDLVISALVSGRQAILLRKGGILEAENQFELEHSRFLFFPTFIHQNPRMVKPALRQGIFSVRQEPDRVEIRGWAEVVRIVEVPSRPALERLDDLHLWDAPLLDMRFAYRPEKPLYLVLLQAFRLPAPVVIANTLEYAGCKSWVPLFDPIDLAGSEPTLPSDQLAAISQRIDRTFAR
jgi:hypothetical protein